MKRTALLLAILLVIIPIISNAQSMRAPSVCYDAYGNGYSKHKMCSKFITNAVQINRDGSREVIIRQSNLYQCDRCNHILASQLDVNSMGMTGGYAERPYPYRISREQLSIEFYPNDFSYSDSIPYGFEFVRGCGW